MFQRIIVMTVIYALFKALMIGVTTRSGKNDVNDFASEEFIVKINSPFFHCLTAYNIIFIPVGILAFLATLVCIAVKDEKNAIYTSLILFCSIFIFILWRYMKCKKIRMTETGIWVKTLLRKEKFYLCNEIRYALPAANKIKLLLGPSRRRVMITRLYDNFDLSVGWLELNCRKIKKHKRKNCDEMLI